MQSNYKMLIGAVIAAALAFAVYYGLISQQTASNIQNQSNQTLGTGPASQQSAPPAPQNPTTQSPAPTSPASPNPTPPSPAPQNPAPAPRQ